MNAQAALALVAALLFGASTFTFARGIMDGPSSTRARLRRRLAAEAASAHRPAETAGHPEEGEEVRPVRQRQFRARVLARLQRANVRWTPEGYLVRSVLTAVVFATAAQAATGLAFLAVIVGPAGAVLPTLYVRRRAQSRQARLNSQVPDMIDLIASSIRSGFGFMQSLELASREQPDPIAEELRQVIREVDLGVGVEEALERLATRTQDQDIELVVQAVLVLRRVGGDIGEVLGRIGDMIRDRIRVRGEIRTLTAQMRMSSWIVGMLPVGLGAITMLMQPEQMSVLFTTPIGQLLVGGAVVLQVIGFLVIRRVSNVTY